MASNQSDADYTVIDELNFGNSTLRSSLHFDGNSGYQTPDTIYLNREAQCTAPNSAYMSGKVSGVMTPAGNSTMMYSTAQNIKATTIVDENY